MLQTGTLLADRYEILQQIGSGGMAFVYRAKDTKLNRFVAIKVLKEEFCKDKTFVSKFRMEAQAAAGLSHANIVSVYDVGEIGSTYFIVMELIEGITLKEYILRKHKLGVKETIGVAIQVAQGLEAAHACHLIHRDIKPQNIIISRDGKIKVTDFGIARAITDETTNMYKAAGSVHYISPEQARGGYCDVRSDIYSLGITMYEMATGRVPFDGETTVAVAIAHMNEAPVRPSAVDSRIPVALEQIILKCIQKKPELRYGNCSELISDLRQAIVTPQKDFVRLGREAQESAADEDYGTDFSKQSPGVTNDTIRISPIPRKNQGRTNSSSDSGNRQGEMRDAERPADRQRGRNRQIQGRRKPPVLAPEDRPATAFDRFLVVIGSLFGIAILGMVVYIAVSMNGILRPAASRAEMIQPQTTQAAEETEEITTEEEEPLTTEKASEGSTLSPKQTVVPLLLGKNLDEVRTLLAEAELEYKASGSYAYSDEYPAGTVCKQQYAQDTVVSKGISVKVTISKGSDKLDFDGSGYIGSNKSALEYILNSYDTLNVVWEVVESNSKKNTIMSMEPEKALLAPGDTIVIRVSSGPSTVEMPDVRGLSKEQAINRLKQYDLNVGKISEAYSDNYDVGVVCDQSTPVYAVINVQSYVDISVSIGRASVEVPYVIGMQEYQARETMNAAQLSPDFTYVPNDAPSGQVIAQSVDAGSWITKWNLVSMTVSTGPEQVWLDPESVTNMTQDEAAAYVIQNGMQYTIGYDTNPWVEAGRAIRLDLPNWGNNMHKGDVVTIVISTGPPVEQQPVTEAWWQPPQEEAQPPAQTEQQWWPPQE